MSRLQALGLHEDEVIEVQSLISLSVDNLINISSRIEEVNAASYKELNLFLKGGADKNEESESRKWLLDVWSYIGRLSPKVQEESYKRLNSRILNCRTIFQLLTLKPDFHLQCVEIGNHLFVDIREEDFSENILTNTILKSHLEKSVIEVRVSKKKESLSLKKNVSELLSLKSLLSHLKCLKIFCMQESNLIEDKELMTALSGCVELSMLDANCSKSLFFQYVLGIKEIDLEQNPHICFWIPDVCQLEDVNKYIQTAKPSWPNLTFLEGDFVINNHCSCKRSFHYRKTIYLLIFAILQKLVFFGRSNCPDILLFNYLVVTQCNYSQYFQGRFKFLEEKFFIFFHSNGLLSDSLTLILNLDKDVNSDEVTALFDILKTKHKSLVYEIQIYIFKLPNSVVLDMLQMFPFLCKMVNHYFFDPLDTTLVIDHFQKLKTILVEHTGMMSYSMANMQPTRFSAAVEYLVLGFYLPSNCSFLNIDFYLSCFPNAENLCIHWICYNSNFKLKIQKLREMTRIKSIHFRVQGRELLNSDMEPLCNLANNASPKTKLIFHFHQSLDATKLDKLKNKGWELRYENPLVRAIHKWRFKL